MSGTVPLFPMYAFIVWTGMTLHLQFVSSFIHKGLVVLLELPTHFLFHGKYRYSFINGRRFCMIDIFFSFISRLLVVVLITHLLKSSLCTTLWEIIIFSGDYKQPLILFSVVLLCLFMNTCIALHAIPSRVSSVCLFAYW